MKIQNKIPTVAIIGCGPRGLSALESLFKEAASQNKKVKAIVFEKSEFPGAGPVYHPNQPDSNWLNVSERAVDIPCREEISFENFTILPFPDYQEWCGYHDGDDGKFTVDRFPLRSHLGKYLNERFESIANILLKKGLMKYINKEVIKVDVENEVIQIDIIGGERFTAQEAVVSVGHQPIELDEQLAEWQNRVTNLDNIVLYTQPYPISKILESQILNSHTIVAVRGFGLAMIDVVRGLTEGFGGKFEIIDEKTREMVYTESGKEPKTIIPFSLDGLPMAPKPLNEKIDEKYLPSKKELKEYNEQIKSSIHSKTDLSSPRFLMEAIAPIIVIKFKLLRDETLSQSFSDDELHEIIISWLSDGEFEHELILSKKLPEVKMMEKFVNMATGHVEPSLDFCIGHVWRHCQPSMYKLLSFAPLPDKLISEIVDLDERLKRYSYGPPVDSIQQILSLVKVGKVSLKLVNDPDINLEEDGWHMAKDDISNIANVMINSVLPPPEILKVASPLPKNLIKDSSVEPLHDELGIRTDKDGTVAKKNSKTKTQLAVLGRLAKGTLIGVDAIAECFGNQSAYWAKGVLLRLKN
ncbi:FAD/NAD(P)-binding protein [Aureibaculum sp. 2210JD6-5]|uniref:FAD/NAD(P)-binding protein n=1 Tax=Aureibaculum sp. 2210JD6-5 TaxID=3103957 RepID=UPI002AADAA45|nr:FAD/NAD(P)-binding protein [Aureibaculum sp. 2210JD6-5]MDY7394996.1 FAD/NAD(P)-binding protein [Aureibaculum sp. 2210JD6-5]